MRMVLGSYHGLKVMAEVISMDQVILKRLWEI